MNFQKLIEKFLQQNGCKIEGYDTDERIKISRNGTHGLLYLGNLRRQYDNAGSEVELEKTLQNLLADTQVPNNWNAAKDSLFLQIQGEDFVAESCLKRRLCKGLQAYAVHSSADGAKLSFVTGSQIKDWKVTNEVVLAQASSNMDKLLAEAKLSVMEGAIKGKLGYFELDSYLKASLILSPHFKDSVQKKLGWPVYVVIPCADFIYITAEQSLVERMGATVLKEFNNSPQPLSCESFVLSDEGIEPFGKFSK